MADKHSVASSLANFFTPVSVTNHLSSSSDSNGKKQRLSFLRRKPKSVPDKLNLARDRTKLSSLAIEDKIISTANVHSEGPRIKPLPDLPAASPPLPSLFISTYTLESENPTEYPVDSPAVPPLKMTFSKTAKINEKLPYPKTEAYVPVSRNSDKTIVDISQADVTALLSRVNSATASEYIEDPLTSPISTIKTPLDFRKESVRTMTRTELLATPVTPSTTSDAWLSPRGTLGGKPLDSATDPISPGGCAAGVNRSASGRSAKSISSLQLPLSSSPSSDNRRNTQLAKTQDTDSITTTSDSGRSTPSKLALGLDGLDAEQPRTPAALEIIRRVSGRISPMNSLKKDSAHPRTWTMNTSTKIMGLDTAIRVLKGVEGVKNRTDSEYSSDLEGAKDEKEDGASALSTTVMAILPEDVIAIRPIEVIDVHSDIQIVEGSVDSYDHEEKKDTLVEAKIIRIEDIGEVPIPPIPVRKVSKTQSSGSFFSFYNIFRSSSVEQLDDQPEEYFERSGSSTPNSRTSLSSISFPRSKKHSSYPRTFSNQINERLSSPNLPAFTDKRPSTPESFRSKSWLRNLSGRSTSSPSSSNSTLSKIKHNDTNHQQQASISEYFNVLEHSDSTIAAYERTKQAQRNGSTIEITHLLDNRSNVESPESLELSEKYKRLTRRNDSAALLVESRDGLHNSFHRKEAERGNTGARNSTLEAYQRTKKLLSHKTSVENTLNDGIEDQHLLKDRRSMHSPENIETDSSDVLLEYENKKPQVNLAQTKYTIVNNMVVKKKGESRIEDLVSESLNSNETAQHVTVEFDQSEPEIFGNLEIKEFEAVEIVHIPNQLPVPLPAPRTKILHSESAHITNYLQAPPLPVTEIHSQDNVQIPVQLPLPLMPVLRNSKENDHLLNNISISIAQKEPDVSATEEVLVSKITQGKIDQPSTEKKENAVVTETLATTTQPKESLHIPAHLPVPILPVVTKSYVKHEHKESTHHQPTPIPLPIITTKLSKPEINSARHLEKKKSTPISPKLNIISNIFSSRSSLKSAVTIASPTSSTSQPKIKASDLRRTATQQRPALSRPTEEEMLENMKLYFPNAVNFQKKETVQENLNSDDPRKSFNNKITTTKPSTIGPINNEEKTAWRRKMTRIKSNLLLITPVDDFSSDRNSTNLPIPSRPSESTLSKIFTQIRINSDGEYKFRNSKSDKFANINNQPISQVSDIITPSSPTSPRTVETLYGDRETTVEPMTFDSDEIHSPSIITEVMGGENGVAFVTGESDGPPIKLTWLRGKKIGSGAFATVYMAMSTTTNEFLAVKQVNYVTPRMPGAREKTRKKVMDALHVEIALLKDLNHQNVVKYYGFDVTDTTVSIFLEYVDGGSVSSLVSRVGALPLSMLQSITQQTLEGLSYLHDRLIIHRDIKGGNILLTRAGIAKIADFGISKKNDQGAAYRPDSKMSFRGSVPWMAPEVVKPNGYSAKVDVWSMGCVVLEMSTGRLPWVEGRRANSLESSLINENSIIYQLGRLNAPPIPDTVKNEELRDFISQCLIINPLDRPQVIDLLNHNFIQTFNIKAFNFEDSYTEALAIHKEQTRVENLQKKINASHKPDGQVEDDDNDMDIDDTEYDNDEFESTYNTVASDSTWQN
ncbi:hypothetical protein HK096_004942 [Nowakowskiella sp. JEL0078]|nr:hypothetical protein HK096_004942 [Nowakowskiella sp. JEL0078]